ncbi:MAG: NfeD family protein [Thermoleophilaceae bacterium]
MPDWVLWMIAAALLAAGEAATLSFILGPIGLAALLAGGVALAGVSIELQFVVFILASIGSLAIVRPIARRHLRTPPQIRTGTAALVGRTALVLDRVDGDGGSVKLGGEVWSARAFDDERVYEPGARVEVLEIEGATALVSE